MDKFLVIGVDTVAGANLATCLAEQHRVWTWSAADGYEIANCTALDSTNSPEELIDACQPDWVIYCGPAARSSWEPGIRELINDDLVAAAEDWAQAAADAKTRLVMISSDAVFNGPWMFHDEESQGLGQSAESKIIRTAEQRVQECCPESLIIRTNTFGWSAEEDGAGWIESVLKTVETRRYVEQDHIRHATPILATDLAEIVRRACLEGLTGIYHVAGAERVSPLSFTQRLADRFELPWLAMRRETSLTELPQGFGEGECSLQTKQIRKELCVAMPLLSEGLQRLLEQASNGYREKLRGKVSKTVARRAA